MRIVYLGNNLTGYNILGYLVSREENIVGLVVHPPEKARYRDEMVQLLHLPPDQVFDGEAINTADTINRMKQLNPDLILSVSFDYILNQAVMELPAKGCINLHSSFLPFNRGQYPNVWSIMESTPAGVTLHYIDNGIDTGDIVAQCEVHIEPTDTGETLFEKLEQASLELFERTWPLIKDGKAPRRPQPEGAGTYHRTKDVEKIDRIDLERNYKAKDLINILRARTFPPYTGAYFEHKGRKVYMRLSLLYEEDL